MGERPCGMVLDRINNDGDYEKTNCHWTTPLANARNKRNSLSPTKRLMIRALLSNGIAGNKIAETLRVGTSSVSRIRRSMEC